MGDHRSPRQRWADSNRRCSNLGEAGNRSLDGGGQGFAVALNGSVVAWWYEGYLSEIGIGATRTVFTEIGPGGKVLPGWPKGSVGAASGPVVWKDGSVHWLEGRGEPVHDAAGAVIGATGICVDIDERRSLLEAEQASRMRLRTLLE